MKRMWVPQIVAVLMLGGCRTRGATEPTKTVTSVLGNQTYAIEARARDEDDNEVTHGMVMAAAHREASKLCRFGFDVLENRDVSRSTTTTDTRGGGTVIGNSVITGERTEASTTSHPRLLVVVRCRLPQQ